MRALFASITMLAASAPAAAGQPVDKQIGFQPAATPIMENIHWFHDKLLLPIITVVALFVLLLLVFVMVRFSKRAHPKPAKFSHNTLVEIIWTGVPVLILIVIAVPSFALLYDQDVMPDGVHEVYGRTVPAPSLTIKAIGNQWYWDYEYPDNGDFAFTSTMLSREDAAAAGRPALLAVDQPVVAPSGATVRMIVTGADVIHNWAMPAFGIKMDAVPGRLNETWFYVEETGTYYGQCSELCGKDHAFMPIQVEIVPRDVFERWASAMSDGDFDGAANVLATYQDGDAGATRYAAAERGSE